MKKQQMIIRRKKEKNSPTRT